MTRKTKLAAAINDVFNLEDVLSNQRVVVSFVAGIATVVLGNIAGHTLTTALMAAAATLTTSAFIALSIYVIGLVITGMLSYYASVVVSDCIATKTIDRCYTKASNAVAGFFRNSHFRSAS